MKNTTKGSPSRSKKTSARSSKKPLTIDLEAEAVEKKTKADDAKAKKAEPAAKAADAKPARKSSVPKTSASKPNPAQEPAHSELRLGRGASKDSASNGGSAKEPAKKTAANQQTAAKSVPPAAEKRQSGGWVGRFASALAGGVVALGGAWFLGVLPVADGGDRPQQGDLVQSAQLSEVRSDLNRQISALQEQLAALGTTEGSQAGTPDLAAVDARVKALLEQAQPAGPSSEALQSDLTALTSKQEEAVRQIETLKSQLLVTDKTVDALKTAISTGAAGEGAGLASLSDQLKAMQVRVDEVAGQEGSASSEAIAEQISGLRAEISEKIAASTSGLAEFDQRIGKLASGQIDLQQQISGFGSLPEQIDALSKAQSELSQQLSAASQGVEAQGQALALVRQDLEKSEQSDRRAASAIAAAALKTTIDEGLPFADALSTLSGLAGASSGLDALQPFAQSGVPTVHTLRQEFEGVGDQILASVQEPQGDDLGSRLLAGAKSLVKIRPINPQSTDGVPAIVASMSEALNNTDLKSAASNWEKLPQAAKDVSSVWHGRLQARLTTDQLVSEAVTAYLKAAPTQ